MKLTRRQFIITISLSALPVVGGVTYFSFKKGNFESDSMNFIGNVLKKYLPRTAIDNESLVRFHKDWVNKFQKSRRIRTFINIQSFVNRLSILSPELSSSIKTLERETLTTFLLNSDFDFDSPQIKTKYLGQHDSICSLANPFARFIQ